MAPVFKNLRSRLRLKLAEHIGVVILYPAPKRVVMGSFDYIDGINLHIAQLLDGAGRSGHPFSEFKISTQTLATQD